MWICDENENYNIFLLIFYRFINNWPPILTHYIFNDYIVLYYE